jgi:anaerobic selenocysteine-containing dehydrogenase
VTVEDGVIVQLEGDPQNCATCGTLCQKGLSYQKWAYSNERLRHPLLKINKHGQEKWERVSWSDALSIICDRFSLLKQLYGPESILYYLYSGSTGLLETLPLAFWNQFGGYSSTYGSLCWGAGLAADQLTFGDNRHSVPWDLVNAKLIVIWGKNPARTNIHQMWQVIEAKERGAKIVVIDSRRTETAEVSDVFIQPEPGTDGALALGIANVLIEQNQIDHDFIQNHVLGFSEYKIMASEYSIERVCEITKISKEDFSRLADLIGITRPMSLIFGYGPQRFSNGGQTVRAVSMLPALTGDIGKPGGGWFFANLQSFLPKGPVLPPAPAGVRNKIHISQIGSALKYLDNPPIKAAWIHSSNPVICNPDSHLLMDGLKNLDFMVVMDHFMTDTAAMADMVLPAKTIFEHMDIVSCYWHPYIQLRDVCIEPYYESRSEIEVFKSLTDMMGYDSSYFPVDMEIYLNNLLHKNNVGCTIDDLRKQPVIPKWVQTIAWEDEDFSTPSGKIEFYSENASILWDVDPLPRYHPPLESESITPNLFRQYPLRLMTALPKQRIHSQFRNIEFAATIDPFPRIEIHPTDAAARLISPGDEVEIYNQMGAIQAKADVTNRIKVGCVNIDKGWWIADKASVNVLSRERLTDIGYGTAFHDCLVNVRLL